MNTQIINVVEQEILDRMRAKDSFTALDISNGLKAQRYPVRHGEVAQVVRDVFQSGAMEFYDYRRDLIDVVTEGGAKTAQAFLYRPQGSPARDYTARAQDALPPVPAEQARDLSDSAPASPVQILPRNGRQRPPRSRARRGRRDGALAIPRSLVGQLGWAAGALLGLTEDGGEVVLGPGDGRAPVKVWSGQRVRLCKLKLRAFGLKADVVTVALDGDRLRIAPKDAG